MYPIITFNIQIQKLKGKVQASAKLANINMPLPGTGCRCIWQDDIIYIGLQAKKIAESGSSSIARNMNRVVSTFNEKQVEVCKLKLGKDDFNYKGRLIKRNASKKLKNTLLKHFRNSKYLQKEGH